MTRLSPAMANHMIMIRPGTSGTHEYGGAYHHYDRGNVLLTVDMRSAGSGRGSKAGLLSPWKNAPSRRKNLNAASLLNPRE